MPSQQYQTIQQAIADCVDGDIVIVAANEQEAYTGTGNKNLDFAGKRITVRSENGPATCTINCEGNGRAFLFHSAETALSVVRGFTIRNGAATDGGAIRCDASGPLIEDCVFESNEVFGTIYGAGKGGAINCVNGANPIISGCVFEANHAYRSHGSGGDGGAVHCLESTPMVVNCVFSGNDAANSGGALYASGGRPVLKNCRVTANPAANGYALYFDSSDPTLFNCEIHDNSDSGAYYGGAVACTGDSTAFITSCTIAKNLNEFGSAGLYCEGDATAVVTNCILWNNTAPQIVPGTTNPDVTYSDVQGGSNLNWLGIHCIDADPKFKEFPETQSLFYGEYYLEHQGAPENDSPCVDAGSDSASSLGLDAYTTAITLAADADEVDMGYHYGRDCDGDGQPDPIEIPDGSALDCNHNGVPDSCDIAAGVSEDANSDGVPDECQGRPDPAYYTLDDDFDHGTLINVSHDPSDQLQRYQHATPLPYLWVPASARGTVLQIYTGSGNTGAILGEYRSAPDKLGSDPSRTSVDLDGRVWVANRGDDNAEDETGSVVRIGLIIGGTRCDGAGAPNPDGFYLKPPFKYNTCVDRDHDGLIHTSPGLGNVFAWAGAYGTAATADDEAVVNYTRVRGTGTRHVSVDVDNNLWAGGHTNHKFDLLDGETGAVIEGGGFENKGGGYGGLIDCNGVLWSAERIGDFGRLLRYNTATHQATYPPESENSYGLGTDSMGNIWNTQWFGDAVMKFDASGTWLDTFDTEQEVRDRGVAVTLADDDVWIVNSEDGSGGPGHSVSRLHNDGEYQTAVDLGDDGDHPTGIAVDQDGYLWATCEDDNTVKRINPSTNAVVLTVDLGEYADPYTYSDMTGQVTLHTSATGTWNVIHDGGHFGGEWHLVLWNREEGCTNPLLDNLTVAVRASDFEAALTSVPYVAVEEHRRFNGVKGRYLEIRVRFKGSCPGVTFETPVLCDLRASYGLGDMNCDGDVNFDDIDPFTVALTGCENYAEQYPACDCMLADINGDGSVDFNDIDPFIALLTGG